MLSSVVRNKGGSDTFEDRLTYLLRHGHCESITSLLAQLLEASTDLEDEDRQHIFSIFNQGDKSLSRIMLLSGIYYLYRKWQASLEIKKAFIKKIQINKISLDSRLTLSQLHAIWNPIEDADVIIDRLCRRAVNHWFVSGLNTIGRSNFEKRCALFGVPVQSVEIKKENLLGSGGFGCVYKLLKPSASVAKVVFRPRIVFFNATKHNRQIVDLIQELYLLKDLDHPNIVKFLGACMSMGKSKLGFELEYADYDLSKVIDKRQRYIPEHQPLFDLSLSYQQKILSDVLSGLIYLHAEKKIRHCDIKSDNVLIKIKDNGQAFSPDSICVKIADFGFALHETQQSDCLCGTWTNLAPELWSAYFAKEDIPYSYASDIFAFAILAWEVCARRIFAPDLSSSESILLFGHRVIAGVRPNIREINATFSPLIASCWSKNQACRSTAKYVHAAFFSSVEKRVDNPSTTLSK